MKIKKSRLKQIVKEELDNFMSNFGADKLDEDKKLGDKVVKVLEKLNKNGDKN